VYDLVAAVLELVKKFGQRLGRGVLEIVHQDDALAVLLQLPHHRVDHHWLICEWRWARINTNRSGEFPYCV